MVSGLVKSCSRASDRWIFLPTRRMFATSQTLEHYGRAWHSLLLTLGICLTNLLERDIPFLWILEISGNFGLVTSESWGNQLPPNKDVFSWRSSGSRNLRWNSEMARTSARSWSNLIKFNQIHTSCGFTLPWLQLSPPFGGVEKNVDRRNSQGALLRPDQRSSAPGALLRQAKEAVGVSSSNSISYVQVTC